MSKLAIYTLVVVLMIVGLIAMYGHGFNLGQKAQLTMQSALDIGKAQYKCEMVKK